jgi:hypothetical protein
VEDVPLSVDQWTQGLYEEINAMIEEMQLRLQMCRDMRTRSLYREIVDMKNDLHKELDLRIQRTNVKIETARTLAETMWSGLETRIAVVKA